MSENYPYFLPHYDNVTTFILPKCFLKLQFLDAMFFIFKYTTWNLGETILYQVSSALSYFSKIRHDVPPVVL